MTQEPVAAEAEEVSSEALSDGEGYSDPKVNQKPFKTALQRKNPATTGVSAIPSTNRGRRIVPVHQSRIKDRPEKQGEKDSSLKIKIELDLEVEVEIYARVKGDVTIGLM
jgi:hypothetical protein